jgi:hypothetical protein
MKNQFNVSSLNKPKTYAAIHQLAGKLIIGLLPVAIVAEFLLLIMYRHR